jgi:flagellar biosynthesis/type III secretory pathway protein FliH
MTLYEQWLAKTLCVELDSPSGFTRHITEECFNEALKIGYAQGYQDGFTDGDQDNYMASYNDTLAEEVPDRSSTW